MSSHPIAMGPRQNGKQVAVCLISGTFPKKRACFMWLPLPTVTSSIGIFVSWETTDRDRTGTGLDLKKLAAQADTGGGAKFRKTESMVSIGLVQNLFPGTGPYDM